MIVKERVSRVKNFQSANSKINIEALIWSRLLLSNQSTWLVFNVQYSLIYIRRSKSTLETHHISSITKNKTKKLKTL